jgi:hypothetical protein
MAAPDTIKELVERYRDNRDDYRSSNYNEFRLRKEFVDPFFEALEQQMGTAAPTQPVTQQQQQIQPTEKKDETPGEG